MAILVPEFEANKAERMMVNLTVNEVLLQIVLGRDN